MSDEPRDPPTRVLRDPVVPAAAERQVVAGPVGVDPNWAVHAEDRLRTLQGLLALMSVLALAALGVAIWALVDDGDGDDPARQGASRGRVAALTDRVERLESRAGRPSGSTAGGQASAADVDGLKSDVAALKSEVAKAGDAGGGESGDASAAGSVSALSTRVDELASQVDELRSQQGADGTGTTP